MKVVFLRAFDKSMEDLPPPDRRIAIQSLDKLLQYFDGGPKPLGLGLRKLRNPYWEVRAGLDKRLLFSLNEGTAVFVLVGNHDEIRRSIRR